MRRNRTIPTALAVPVLAVLAAGVGMATGALPALGDQFVSPLGLPSTEPQGFQTSPLRTPVPLGPELPSGDGSGDTAVSVPVATPTIPPPPGYPSGEPWPPPTATPGTPGVRRTRPESLVPSGSLPNDVSPLYYVANNMGFAELHAIGMDAPAGQQPELRAPNDSVLASLNVVGLHPSPDGQYVVLELRNPMGGYGEIQVMERRSGRVWCPLEEPASCWGGFWAWGPDNTLLFRPFDGQPEGVVPNGVMIVDLPTGHYTQLDLPVEPRWGYSLVQNVAVRADGSGLAYTITYWENQGEISELWVAGMDGGEKQLIRRVRGLINPGTLSWSPAGDELIYLYQAQSGQFNPSELWLLGEDGREGAVLANDLPMPGEPRYRPVWSPDGASVAFVRGGDAYVVDVDTREAIKLSEFDGRDASYPTWAPDGRSLAFVSAAAGNEQADYAEVWLAEADGTQLRLLSEVGKTGNALGWLPALLSDTSRR